ncbi:hypothetical protein J4573_05605 [Actinomadura barringtoniae]|uniref:Uncharacterized protein n=1 Tax=Actinomadura barringtoniae TaxID=1427535 RepID=A0A939T114_9ACTN|nr:hypothetical protein [Actinomadura barringtoniae]MBO2446556.1 hypothetical protein [Actinomadura barringtoniae]
MTTDPHEEHGEILRRALNAEADTVIPSVDGLDQIRARIEQRRQRRFGWAWFTAGWARPILAVGAAVAIAGVGVSAPQTFNLISPAGNKGPSADQRHQPGDGSTEGEQGRPGGTQAGSPPGASPSGTNSSSESPVTISSSPSPSCTPAPAKHGGGSPSKTTTAPSPGATVPGTAATPCPSPSTSTTPPTTPPTSEKPTDKPTENPDPTPSVTPSAASSASSETKSDTGTTTP